jgi:hypothetical protein
MITMLPPAFVTCAVISRVDKRSADDGFKLDRRLADDGFKIDR